MITEVCAFLIQQEAGVPMIPLEEVQEAPAAGYPRTLKGKNASMYPQNADDLLESLEDEEGWWRANQYAGENSIGGLHRVCFSSQ